MSRGQLPRARTYCIHADTCLRHCCRVRTYTPVWYTSHAAFTEKPLKATKCDAPASYRKALELPGTADSFFVAGTRYVSRMKHQHGHWVCWMSRREETMVSCEEHPPQKQGVDHSQPIIAAVDGLAGPAFLMWRTTSPQRRAAEFSSSRAANCCTRVQKWRLYLKRASSERAYFI